MSYPYLASTYKSKVFSDSEMVIVNNKGCEKLISFLAVLRIELSRSVVLGEIVERMYWRKPGS